MTLPTSIRPSGLAPLRSHRAGLTLLELTVVIAVTLVLIAMTFVGARAWKEGADRASCVMNIYHVQEAVRAHAAVNGFHSGEDVSAHSFGANLFSELVGEGKYLEEAPACPQDGLYVTTGNVIPAYGELYMVCSLSSTQGHIPGDFDSW